MTAVLEDFPRSHGTSSLSKVHPDPPLQTFLGSLGPDGWQASAGPGQPGSHSRPLLPILWEPAQSWSNLRSSQSDVRGMADPPAAVAQGPVMAASVPQQLSPLSGAYLLCVIGEPFSDEHKKLILQKLHQGKRSPAAAVVGEGCSAHRADRPKVQRPVADGGSVVEFCSRGNEFHAGGHLA